MVRPTSIDPKVARSLAHAKPLPFWLDRGDEPEPLPALAGHVTADLAIRIFERTPLAAAQDTHAWGGIIDACSRFCAFFGTAHGGRLVCAAGYLGFGVGATRFAAQVLLDRLSNDDTERSRLALVRSKPLPLPPEQARSAVIQLTRASIARADAHEGRRDGWLRLLDRIGLGFDS